MGEYFENAARKLAAGVNVPGFRPGHAPLNFAQNQIGEEKILEETLQTVVPISYYEAIKKENLTPLHEPKVTVKEFGRGKALEYEAEFDILPQVKLGDYKKIRIKKYEIRNKIDEKEIEAGIKQLQRQMADMKSVERESKQGDFLEIDFESFIDGCPVPNSKSQNHPVVIGQGQFVPDFEKNLVGLKREQEKNFSVNFPQDFHNKEIAGKKVEFKVKVREIKEIILPKIDDEFVIKLGKKNIAELKKSIEESLKKDKETKEEMHREEELLNKIAEKSEVEIPESLVLAETQRLLSLIASQIERGGLKFEDYLKNIKKEVKDLIVDLRPQAEKNVKISLVLQEIRKQEKIEVSEAELESEIKRLEAQKIIVKDEERERLKSNLAIKKTVEQLKKNS